MPVNVLNLRVARNMAIGTIALGTLGFRFIAGYSWINAFYMTIITVSTVGFGEVAPLSPAGRLFTSVFIVINVLLFAYVLATFSYYVIEGKIFKSMHEGQIRNNIAKLSGHTIVCGYGKYGHEIVDHLRRQGEAFVVIEMEEEKIENLRGEGHELLYLLGDATQDDMLEAAGIARADSLITALADDTENLFIVLSANDLNPDLHIISRAQEERSRRKLLKAGANHVIMPEQIGGFYMATLVSKPGTVEFFSFITSEMSTDICFEELSYVQLPSKYQGRPIRELSLRRNTGVNIISYRRPNGSFLLNPGPDTILEPDGSFIVLGNNTQLSKLHKYLGK